MTQQADNQDLQSQIETLRAQLFHSQKMAAVGMMVNGVAHEFNNMLQIINGYAQLAGASSDPVRLKEAAGVILETSDRASRVIRNLLTFSRPDGDERDFVKTAELVDAVISLVEYPLCRANIRVVREYCDDASVYVCGPAIQQVFLNIINNARDAMAPAGSGQLTIRVDRAGADSVVVLADSGPGIPGGGRDRLFQPFYTTKISADGTSVGTGLGLYISRDIVQRHGGSISLDSEPGRGTAVTVRLPYADDTCQK